MLKKDLQINWRGDEKDMENLNKLSEQLGVSHSAAIRYAIEFALECKLTLRAEDTAALSEKWQYKKNRRFTNA